LILGSEAPGHTELRQQIVKTTAIEFTEGKTQATPPAWPARFSHFILSAWPSQMAGFHSSVLVVTHFPVN